MTAFQVHDKTTAPTDSHPEMSGVEEKFGFMPNIYGVFAESPAIIKAYVSMTNLLGNGSFSPPEQQLMLLTVSAVNGCGYCVAAHTMGGRMTALEEDVIQAIRNNTPVADKKLAALHAFTKSVVENRGNMDVGSIEAFMDAGYTKAHVLEVNLAVAIKTMSNYINHMADTPLDEAFEPARWDDAEAYVA
ncbi:MAG: carboxymuconolactone decarboxylase family protein [Alphaproteobacteria bacterium]